MDTHTKFIGEEVVSEGECSTPLESISMHKTVVREFREATVKSPGPTGYRYRQLIYRYSIVDQEGHTHEFESRRLPSRKPRVWLGLLERTEGSLSFVEQEDVVPIEIAASGKPELAGYLFVVHDLSPEEIGKIVGVSKQTIQQYLSDVSHGRRKKN